MEGSSNSWMEEDWTRLDPDFLIPITSTRFEPNLWNNIPGRYPTTIDPSDLLNSVDAGALRNTDALDMSAPGRLEQSNQHIWAPPPDLCIPQQYDTNFLDGNINLGPIGSHQLYEFPVDPDISPNKLSLPPSGVEPQRIPTNPSGSFSQGILSFRQGFTERDLSMDIPSMGFEHLNVSDTGTPSSLAIRTLSSEA
ncbi:hypothetical protein VMCG_00669 [Cytospora schulzeri]|uniref:Uncharacterized protein n=1 Tax=Cytospora schulzeri TaxID=448051 RepID=A0A423XA08_9PEZI|nr:hypothetical protein VMCG_00669 [Valsa malicola]